MLVHDRLCICLSASISPEPLARSLYQIFVDVAYGRGLVLLRRHCDAVCTSGFMDDIMFFFNCNLPTKVAV